MPQNLQHDTERTIEVPSGRSISKLIHQAINMHVLVRLYGNHASYLSLIPFQGTALVRHPTTTLVTRLTGSRLGTTASM